MSTRKKLFTLEFALGTLLTFNLVNTAWASQYTVRTQETTPAVQQQNVHSHLLTIQHKWAQINYRTKKDEKEAAFEDLIKEIDELASAYPNDAEPKIWQGIIRSTYAGVKGGLSALSLVKSAREYLEVALEINDKALNGSAYTSLATLYSKVPGWPIGFGDDDKAADLFDKALKINPAGIDPNYFYAEYLFDEGGYDEAYAVLVKAQEAPARKGRPIADEERHKEIDLLLEQVIQEI